MLRLVGEVNVVSTSDSTALMTIDGPSDVLWLPLNSILVPVSTRLEVLAVPLVVLLPLPDDVGAERMIVDGWHNLDVDLVPAFLSPVRAIPVSEERADGARLARTLHADGETSVSEGLVGFDFTTAVVRSSEAGHSQGNSESRAHLGANLFL